MQVFSASTCNVQHENVTYLLETFMLSDRCKRLRTVVGSLLCKAPSANDSNFSRSLIVSWGPELTLRDDRFLQSGTTCSSLAPSFSVGQYWRLSIDFLRPSAALPRLSAKTFRSRNTNIPAQASWRNAQIWVGSRIKPGDSHVYQS